jgi:Gram-negative porin
MFNLYRDIHMKKTLVALAVLAASGASFAQATITGAYAYGYQMKSNVGGVSGTDSSGFGIDTSYLQFDAKEDLGGGLTAAAMMSIDGMNRSGIAGGDSSFSLTGNFGRIAMGNGRGPDTMTDYVKGAVGMDGKVFSALTTSENISYLTPELIPGLRVQFQHLEGATSQATENAAPIGLGVGATGTSIQRRNDIRFQYAQGPLAAAVNFLSYDQQGTSADTTNAKNATRGYVRYDLGVAQVGAALYQLNYQLGKRTDAMVAVNVPMGAWSLGAEWAQRAKDGTAADSTISGTAVQAVYSLSKRTSVTANYARWDVAGGTGTVAQTTVLLGHSF